MWQHMEKNPKCGGVCGYMGLRIESAGDELGYRSDGFDRQHRGWCTRFCDCLLSIQRAQQFEYHYAHMLDKPFEAFFNYIHVLPGAFSGYRWKALKSISCTN
jgi:chitin synthase